MGRRIDARDVLDANARTVRGFSGDVVGYYRPTGPNAWDDYEYVAETGGRIEVMPALNVQVERWGIALRMRSRGRVVRVQWRPSDEERETFKGKAALRERLLTHYVEPFDHQAGVGASAFIAGKLKR